VAICNSLDDSRQSQQQSEEILAHLHRTGPILPEGARLLLCGPANPGWRVVTVWDSQEVRDRFFADRLGPAYEAIGLSLQDVHRTQFEVQMLIAGDLVGPPQSPAAPGSGAIR